MKNSLKQREFEIADSAWLRGKFKGNGFNFEITGKLKLPSLNYQGPTVFCLYQPPPPYLYARLVPFDFSFVRALDDVSENERSVKRSLIFFDNV